MRRKLRIKSIKPIENGIYIFDVTWHFCPSMVLFNILQLLSYNYTKCAYWWCKAKKNISIYRSNDLHIEWLIY